ncbi:MAG: hypothetical protein RL398_3059 [Planctomycetota bacterium]|jgi:hypothetical protein
MQRTLPIAALLLAACATTAPAPAPAPTPVLRHDEAARELRIDVEGRTVLGWQYAERFAIPHWFPLTSPSGKDLLAQFPEPFPHHRAMWIADKVQLDGGPIVDFYHCPKNQLDARDPAAGYRHFIRQTAMPRCEVRDGKAFVEVELQWLVDGKQAVLDDRRTFVVTPLPDGEALIDLAWTLRASHGNVKFHSDWVHYAWPYLRIQPQFAVERGGALLDDAGRQGQRNTDAQYANWIDYSAVVDGRAEGVAVFVPQDGSWRKWLTRDYGTFGPRRPDALSGTGFTLTKGESLDGSVRLYVHQGRADAARVAARYRDYVRETGR